MEIQGKFYESLFSSDHIEIIEMSQEYLVLSLIFPSFTWDLNSQGASTDRLSFGEMNRPWDLMVELVPFERGLGGLWCH